MKKKSILSQFTNIYNNLEEYLLIISLVCNVLLVFLQVIMRTVFKNSLTWSEELARYMFVWLALLHIYLADMAGSQYCTEIQRAYPCYADLFLYEK